MKKLFLLIPATLIFSMSFAQDSKQPSQKTSALDGKSFKISMTEMGTQNTQPVPGAGTQESDMQAKERAATDAKKGQTDMGKDKDFSGKTATLKFKDGMIKSSFAGAGTTKDCGYKTTNASTSADAIGFSATCTSTAPMNSSDKSNSSGNSERNSGGTMNSSGTNSTTTSSGSDNTSTGTSTTATTSSGTMNTTTNANGTTVTTTAPATGTDTNSATASLVEWNGTVTGNNITGTLRVSENGQNRNYNFTGTMVNGSSELGMEK